MNAVLKKFRLSAATGTHQGDRPYQQDQVAILRHPRVGACLLAIVADGMGGKSGGRKAADQVLLTCGQIFERFMPESDDPAQLLHQLVSESHLMIKLTAISSEEEPHSTLAAFLVLPGPVGWSVHAGDSRVYHFKGSSAAWRSLDHSYVQQLVSAGKLTEEAARSHPQSNLLTGCLGATQDPPMAIHELGALGAGDTLLAGSDGLWSYFSERELGTTVHLATPREACEILIGRARQRARGGGDNLSLAVVRIEPL
ncbi:MAG: PP2C family protein-serine/threonine phosphatase [Rubrivivax sp.]